MCYRCQLICNSLPGNYKSVWHLIPGHAVSRLEISSAELAAWVLAGSEAQSTELTLHQKTR